MYLRVYFLLHWDKIIIVITIIITLSSMHYPSVWSFTWHTSAKTIIITHGVA